jgi:hypothetical protein
MRFPYPYQKPLRSAGSATQNDGSTREERPLHTGTRGGIETRRAFTPAKRRRRS